MATKKKSTSNNTVSIVGATNERQEKAEKLSGSNVVTLRVSLRRGYAMDDIPDGNGGTKRIILPALDSALKGQRQGILTPDGNALFIQMPKSDWEAVKKIHGRERMFNSYKGNPPCIAEVSDTSSQTVKDEIKSVKTGYAPQNPSDLGVEEVTGEA